MRRTEEYEEHELLGMDRETVRRLIDYECALASVPLLPEDPGPEPEAPPVKPDVTLYGVGGWYFRGADEAESILVALHKTVLYETTGYGIEEAARVVDRNRYDYPKVRSETVLSQETLAQHREALDEHKAEKSRWSERKKAWDAAVAARASIVRDIEDRIDQARENQNTRDQLQRIFARYLDLADGNREVALRFLRQAQSATLQKFPDLVEEFTGAGVSS